MSIINQSSQALSSSIPPRCTSAAEAEEETLFCLKRECKALKMAMRTLPKHSKGWTTMNTKLEIAMDELEAMLEDIKMTQNYATNVADGGNIASVRAPTPPLSSSYCLTPVKSFIGQGSSHGSDTDSSMEINELFTDWRLPALGTNEKAKVDVENLRKDLDRAEKFSLEYFKIKKKIDRANKRSSSLSPSSETSSDGSAISLNPEESLKSFQECPDEEEERPTHLKKIDSSTRSTNATTSPLAPPQQLPFVTPEKNVDQNSGSKSVRLGNGLGNLVDLLDVVPKYSLEWFKLKKDIKAASGDQTSTKTLRKHKSSHFDGTQRVTQFKKMNSSEVTYPIPHAPHSRTVRRKTMSKDSQTFEDLDAQYFYVRMCRHIVTVQNIWRGRTQRIIFIQLKSAAICIQSAIRMSSKKKIYFHFINGVILIQKQWRRHAQRTRSTSLPITNIEFPHSESYYKVKEPNAPSSTINSSSMEEEDFMKIQKSIEAMKNEKMSMEMKLLQLKNDIDVIKNEKLRQDLDRMRLDIESLKKANEDVLFDKATMPSAFSNVRSVPTNILSVVLKQKGHLGIEMKHHKSSDTVRVTHVKKRSQAEKAGLQSGDIVINFRTEQYPDGMTYEQFIPLATEGVRPLILDITRVDPSVVGSSIRSGLFKRKMHR